ncbi:hypothetical protein [Francisella tularensis]|uniref:hypothetical protein n=1 Tax=Francisella tularensis TaxID=263 RepID=UPI0016807F69|nr:hypothetical protein [Francisella tularensis]MBD2809208.1 hypothetical protein [Francisella tularensis]
MIKKNPKITIKKIAENIYITVRSVKNHINTRKCQGFISRELSNRNGYWKVI